MKLWLPGIKLVYIKVYLENKILKFENNCQIYDDTNRSSPFNQQSSQDVLRKSLYFHKYFRPSILHT